MMITVGFLFYSSGEDGNYFDAGKSQKRGKSGLIFKEQINLKIIALCNPLLYYGDSLSRLRRFVNMFCKKIYILLTIIFIGKRAVLQVLTGFTRIKNKKTQSL